MARTSSTTRRAGIAGAMVAILIATLVSATPVLAADGPTTSITGTVTEGDPSGPGIPGASVTLVTGPGTGSSRIVASTTTSESGEYLLEAVPLDIDSYTLRVTPPSGSPYVGTSIEPVVPDPAGGSVVDVSLALGASITGTVGTTAGTSPEGATVSVFEGQSAYPTATRTVGADGAFEVRGLRAVDYRVRATLAGTSPAEVGVTGVVVGATYPVTLKLLSPGVVSGTVTSSATGEPIPDMEVRRSGQSAQTDANGFYALTAATIGSFPVTVSDPLGGFVPRTTGPVTVATAQTVDAVDVALDPAAIITGTITASDGTPIGGVRVTSLQFDRDLSGYSDYQGRYRIGGVPAGTYTLLGQPEHDEARDAGLETSGPTITVSGGETREGVDFALDPLSIVSGTFTRSLPLEGDVTTFRITFISLEEDDVQDGFLGRSSVRPDADGHYAIPLRPARYLIHITPAWNGESYDTTYKPSYWENMRRRIDDDYPSEALDRGAKILVVERTTPISLDLAIDRGESFTANPAPTITGTAVAGQTLTATIGTWTPTPDTFRYEWRRDSIPIAGETSLSHLLTDEDVGHEITFAVTGSRPANGVATVASTAVIPVRLIDPAPRPTIQGEPAVGATLTAVTGEWGPAPITFTYQWKRNGTPIAGQTTADYVVQPVDARSKISVAVTGSKSGYPSVTQTSPSIAIVAPPPVVERIAGADRYEVSALISQRLAPTGSALLYLASGEVFADALSGSAIAAQRDAPLLLSTRSSVPAAVAAEIRRLAPADIVVLGGENTLAPSVITQLEGLVSGVEVHRIGGADRFAVSRALILDPEFGAAPSENLYLATGLSFPDALSGAPAAAHIDAPVLLVDGRRTAFTAAERSLLRERDVQLVTILGGTASVSSALENQLSTLGVSSGRVTGADRYVVSAKISARSFPIRYPRDVVYIASGQNFPDALSGGALAGSGSSTPLYLAQKGCLDQAMIDRITGLQPKTIVILGGPNSIAFGGSPIPACPGR